jgi:hypothetical protein
MTTHGTKKLGERDAWTSTGHASEAALALLEAGDDALLPEELPNHVYACGQCCAALGEAAMLREAVHGAMLRHRAELLAPRGAMFVAGKAPVVAAFAAAVFAVAFTLFEISPAAQATIEAKGRGAVLSGDAAILFRHLARLAGIHNATIEVAPIASSLVLCGLAMVLIVTRGRWARPSSAKGVS